MRKFILLLIFSFLVFQVFGKNITVEQAKSIASKFLAHNGTANLKSGSSIQLFDAGNLFRHHNLNTTALKSASAGNRELYAFNIGENRGFIIISGDDAAIPVLGYADSGHIDADKIPPTVLKWLEGYKKQIQYIQANHLQQSDQAKAMWEGSFSYLKSTSSSVEPLLTTKWDQSPYFNDMCPWDESYQERTVTGCPATAMAQIMKYWEYPQRGSGFHSYQHERYGTLSANFGATNYDWEAMPDVVDSPNEAVAILMYQCGVAVEMNYNVEEEGGSGSYVIKDKRGGYDDTQTVEYALSAYFGYASTINGIARADYTDEEWKNILIAELDAGRPIQYAGYGQGGHTFVCDGYNESDYFHINWGWGGYCDGFYLLDNLVPGTGGIGAGAGSYNDGQQALIGIQPPPASLNYKLKINSDVAVDKPTISYTEGFTVTTDILNDGDAAFTGDYGAAVFDEDDVFVDFVEIKTGNTLNAGYHYGNGISFTTTGLVSLLPGNYHIYIFSRPADGNWNMISTGILDLFTTDHADLTVVNENDISLYAPISAQEDVIYRNHSLTVSLDVANYASNDFSGAFNLSLFTPDGDFVTTIEEKNNVTLGAGMHYADGITFSTSDIDVDPGSYLLVLFHQWEGTDYEITGSTSTYINPVKITIQANPLQKDQYELNDSIEDAYVFIPSWPDDAATIETTGANIHTGSDWDFYSVELEDGYTYDITMRLNDSYNSGNGTDYTVDGLFLYSLDGINWSEAYDDVMPSSIATPGNKTLYCVVSPLFLGETGTYQLDINLHRSLITSAPEPVSPLQISLYPIPCEDRLNMNTTDKLKDYVVYDINGRNVLAGTFNTNPVINVASLRKGLYFINITTATDTYTKKFIKK